MARKWSEIRKGPPPKSLSPEEHSAMAERLARLDRFCGELTNSDRDDPSAELLELSHCYTRSEITFEQFRMAYWQTRPVGERLEETWRLSDQAFSEANDDSADGKG